MHTEGTVFWITGLSGAGKTTLAQYLNAQLCKLGHNSVFLDGDELREVFGKIDDKTGNYTRKQRLSLALQYSKLSKLIAGQGVNVVVATISMFDEIYIYNRRNIKNYLEIFIDTPLSVLKVRNSKGLYVHHTTCQSADVVGIDIKIDIPAHPSIKINYSDGEDIKTSVNRIIEFWNTPHEN